MAKKSKKAKRGAPARKKKGMKKAKPLLDRCLPSLQATELSGSNGEAPFPKNQSLDMPGLAGAIGSLLREAALRAPSAPRPVSTIDENAV